MRAALQGSRIFDINGQLTLSNVLASFLPHAGKAFGKLTGSVNMPAASSS